MINRKIENKLVKMATKFPILAITGPRQSGKTTLCQKLFKKYRYISLENLDNKEYAISDPKGFLEEYNDKVIIDEAQNAPELFSYIQGMVDESGKTGQYILTGSQNFLLLSKISQTLAGRVYIYHLLPFSHNELKATYNQTIWSSIFKGGYPRIYDKKINPKDFFPSYVQTYLERDVRSIMQVNNLSLFGRFLKMCAGRIGQIFNASSLANELGIDYKTIQSWLSVLETSFIVYRLQPWHKNFNKRIVKSPKLYFYDTGLASYLLGLKKQEDINFHFIKGALFENFIVTEYIKTKWNKGEPASCYYWRDSTGNEIDLLIDNGEQLKIIEIKASQTIKQDFFKGINRFEKLASKYTLDKYLVYAGKESQKRTNVQVLSWTDLKTI